MAYNPFAGAYERFFRKSKAVFYCDELIGGRKTFESKPSGLFKNYGVRTGFFGGKMTLSGVPKVNIHRAHTSQNPEGIDIILPYKPGSIGWDIFINTPLAKLKILEHRIGILEMEITSKIERRKELSPTEFKEVLHEVFDMVEKIKTETANVSAGMPMAAIPPSPADAKTK